MCEDIFRTGIQFGLGLIFAPLLAGVIKKIKAWMQHRKGPSVLQPWFDLWKLFRKQMVISETTSWIFKVPPFLEFGIALFLLMVVAGPFLISPNINFGVDLIFILYLWALARFFTALAGLDAGSAFGGMGSSREMTVAAMVEPGLILVLFIIGFRAANLNLSQIFSWASYESGWVFSPVYLLAAGAYLILMIAETGRIPVDNPDTHLELTMIHEGMILEYSGPYLALINWSVMIRQYLFYSIFVNVFLPGPVVLHPGISDILVNGVQFIAKLVLVGLIVAVTESTLAKMRLLKVPRLLWAAFAFGVMALLTVVF
jgi:formate hydrogenlyase subunit 4